MCGRDFILSTKEEKKTPVLKTICVRMDWAGWPYWEYKQIKHITFTVSLISGGARVSSRDSAGKMLLIRQFLTDMFVSTSVSEEKECSELPEQPAAPGNQEERSVWNTDPQVKDRQLLLVDQQELVEPE